MTQPTIGIDISKDTLDVYHLPDQAHDRFPNTKVGIAGLIRQIGHQPVKRIVFEATGPYHRALECSLSDKGLPLCKVNPLQARRFAEAKGTRAKTDKVDAAMLAAYGVMLQPQPQQAKSPALENLCELVTARRALVKDRTAAKNRLHNLASTLLKRQAHQRLKQIDDHIQAIDQQGRALVEAEPALQNRRRILASIPGLGDITIITMLAGMPELGTMDKRQAASLAGLAPITRQSGTWKGKSFIQGGRAMLRQALYMPALVAVRFNPVLKAKYDQLITAGKPPKVAITAIMRKLVIIANALIRDNRTWTPKTT